MRLMRYISAAAIGMSVAFPVLAALPSMPVRQAVVIVICGTRKGTGAVIHGPERYVLTNGHIAIDGKTGATEDDCEVRFIGADGLTARSVHDATVVHAVYDDALGLDYAIIRVGGHRSGPPVAFPSAIPVSTKARAGDAVTVLGYPHTSEVLSSGEGIILDFARGSFYTDAAITEGYSGGPVLNANEELVGVATRLRLIADPDTGETEPLDYGAGDTVPLMTWLDTFGASGAGSAGAHDLYLTHAAGDTYDSEPYVIRDELPGCDEVVRTDDSPAVYCLRTGRVRSVFPDTGTFFSWYSGFSNVKFATTDQLVPYRLTGIVTHRAGTLLKIQSDPRVYLVTDSIGTLREVPNEEYAARVFGAGWASHVVDISEAFFPAYRVGAVLQ